ncbi:MAG: YfcC family protein [Lachnospiraceae bacterium]|nr:YfcC family protein [Lachnospiraceae bacterium]
MDNKPKKSFKMPHSFIAVIFVLILVSVMTYLVPAGKYGVFVDAAGKESIDPSNFQYIDSTPVSIFLIPYYIVRALIKQVNIIIPLFVISGGLEVIIKTNTMHAFCCILGEKCTNGNQKIFIPLLIFVFSMIGITQAPMKFIGFAPIGVMLAVTLGYDAVVGVAIALCGIGLGFSAGIVGPTTAVAQELAGIPAYSGLSMRVAAHAVLFVVTAVYIVRYGERVRKEPAQSVLWGAKGIMEFRVDENKVEMNRKHCLVLATFIIGFIAMMTGCLKWGWDLPTTSVVFIWMAIIGGLVYGFSPSEICEIFVSGAKGSVFSAMIVGLGAAAALMMDDANILDTVVMALASCMSYLPVILRAPAMFIMNTVINFFVSSATGQSAIVMPIFTPLADLSGVTRQTAVLAYKLGDGLSNYIFPHVSSLMGFIGAAGISYDRWMRFMWKLFIMQALVSVGIMMLCQMISYT